MYLQQDCVEALAALPAQQASLACVDPPFNISHDYDVYVDDKSKEDYLEWSRSWITQVYRVLQPDGSLWLMIGDEYAAELKVLCQQLGFHCRSWVIWFFTFGVNCDKKFTRSHTHLFHFVKNPKQFTFNASELLVPSARQLVYNDKRANAAGRLPDDTWILRPQMLPEGTPADGSVWYFPRVAGTFKERAGFHGCQMPEQILGRIIRCSSNPGELILDPMAGSGVSLIVAKKLGRRYLGYDISADYVRQGNARLDATHVGDELAGSAEPWRGPDKPAKKAAKKA